MITLCIVWMFKIIWWLIKGFFKLLFLPIYIFIPKNKHSTYTTNDAYWSGFNTGLWAFRRWDKE